MSIEKEMESLVKALNYYTKMYDGGNPVISDKSWDDMYFKLLSLEKSAGYALSDSPTQTIQYKFDVVEKLDKVTHDHPMLSLHKTKSLDEALDFLGIDNDVIVMPKLDGLTISLRYENGKLVKAETRGDGLIGEDVTHNAFVVSNIPKKINYTDTLVVDGELICKLNDFIHFAEEYKNPRNFAAGSIRLLDSKICANRKLSFVVWDVIQGLEDNYYLSDTFQLIDKLGFETVPRYFTHKLEMEDYENIFKDSQYPIDGFVFKYDNRLIYKGRTEHHFKNAIAYKFYDESYPTALRNIEWTMGRTGVLTPVAVFDPITIDGSIVERASLHNLSVLMDTAGGGANQGDILYIYKANMIIPQVEKWEHNFNGSPIGLIKECPICGESVVVEKSAAGISNLVCSNPNCEGKLINKLDHFCGKKGLDIKGLSKKTLEKLIDWEWLSSIEDIYTLENHEKEWINKSGFGEKSVYKILDEIHDKSKSCELSNLLCSIGIPMIGTSASKILMQTFKEYTAFREAVDDANYSFSDISGFGSIMNSAIKNFDYSEIDKLVYNGYIKFKEITEDNTNKNSLEGLTFVITGKLTHFKNRAEIEDIIKKYGGKTSSTISGKTSFLINNDNLSTSAKNRKAQELNIPILTEEKFLELLD